jgi:hypothetical protein
MADLAGLTATIVIKGVTGLGLQKRHSHRHPPVEGQQTRSHTTQHTEKCIQTHVLLFAPPNPITHSQARTHRGEVRVRDMPTTIRPSVAPAA